MLLTLSISAAMNAAVEYKDSLGGSASGLIGFMQIGSGALGTLIVSYLLHMITIIAMIMIACMVITLIGFCIMYFFVRSPLIQPRQCN